MTSLARWASIIVCAAAATAAFAQTLTTLVSFKETDGLYPEAALVQGTDGNFYGTAIWGGNLPCYAGYGCGTVFRMTPSGQLTILYRFCSQPNCTDGAEPYAGLIQATDGNFYGTTYAGGTGRCGDGVIPGCGTVFKITPAGGLTTLYSFCTRRYCGDGTKPFGALTEAAGGKFYGTTSSGGANWGTVFKITSEGKLTTLHMFYSFDGRPAAREGLVQSGDGNFYGTTSGGGAHDGGTIFKMTAGGDLTTLYRFCSLSSLLNECADGQNPLSGLFLGTNGDFYGTTLGGGVHNEGTVFRITRSRKLTTLYSFCAVRPDCIDGAVAYGRLIQAADGHLYGTTYSNGLYGGGTVFEITRRGELITLYNFCELYHYCPDGAYPEAGLVQGSDGNFYGTTTLGGIGNGTIFRLNVARGNL